MINAHVCACADAIQFHLVLLHEQHHSATIAARQNRPGDVDHALNAMAGSLRQLRLELAMLRVEPATACGDIEAGIIEALGNGRAAHAATEVKESKVLETGERS